MTDIEALQKIVADESLPAEQRKQAAEHILKLQGEQQPADTKAQEHVLFDRMLDESLSHEERLHAATEAVERGFIPTGSAYFPITVTPATALNYANRPTFKACWYAVRNNPARPRTDADVRASITRVLGKLPSYD